MGKSVPISVIDTLLATMAEWRNLIASDTELQSVKQHNF